MVPRKSVLLVLASLLVTLPAGAQEDTLSEQEWAEYIRTFTTRKEFLIAGTFRSFRDGTAHARRLAQRTGLDYRPQTTLTEQGELTYSRELCEENGWDYPCYVPRGRFDDGVYLSVEPTDGYNGMQPGYFIVIVASGFAEQVLQARRELAERRIPMFVKSAPIWMGCMH